jgi:N-acetylmuramic acid 6-phosphate (MurNAc-6-P) etherase
MKAGTARRIALNLLSSLLMIRLGRVYEGLDGGRAGARQALTNRPSKRRRSDSRPGWQF